MALRRTTAASSLGEARHVESRGGAARRVAVYLAVESARVARQVFDGDAVGVKRVDLRSESLALAAITAADKQGALSQTR